jgi:Domain of unknown function (DUF3850)
MSDSPAVHRLKTWVPYFDAVVSGAKPFEVRRDDRGFQRGDRVRLIEVTRAVFPRPTGREAEAEITYVLTGGQFGIEPGYVVLGLSAVQPLGEDREHG